MNLKQHNSCSSQTAAIKLSGAELIGIFPEAKHIVPALAKELNAKRNALVLYIGTELAAIKAKSDDEIYGYFWRLWLMLNEGEELQVLDGKLAQLYRLLRIIQGRPAPKGRLPEDMVQAARDVPVESLLDQQTFHRSGHDFTTLCPLHDDHTPSLRVYREQNRVWCFVCQNGGDSIQLYMLLNDCDFKTTVTELAGGVA